METVNLQDQYLLTSGGGANGGSGGQSEQIDISKMTPNQMMAMGRENK